MAVKIYNLCGFVRLATNWYQLSQTQSSYEFVLSSLLINHQFLPPSIKCSHAVLKCGSVQSALVVHVVSVRSARGMSNFTQSECVSISAGHGPGTVVGAGRGC